MVAHQPSFDNLKRGRIVFMRLLRMLGWLLVPVLVVGVATYLVGHYDVSDRLMALFLMAQSWLPLMVDWEQFLIVLTVASLLIMGLVIMGCAILDAILRQWPVGRLRVADRGIREGLLLGMMAKDAAQRMSLPANGTAPSPALP